VWVEFFTQIHEEPYNCRMDAPQPPRQYRDFLERFPKLGEAWDAMREAEGAGPLDPRAQRLLKLAVAIGASREGAVRSAARKALRAGAAPEELHQVVALAASTVGMPGAVAAFDWINQALQREKGSL
jgi:alkylhydroperoxidase/carboxymuconolactone decarboxylase family protein YurZ